MASTLVGGSMIYGGGEQIKYGTATAATSATIESVSGGTSTVTVAGGGGMVLSGTLNVGLGMILEAQGTKNLKNQKGRISESNNNSQNESNTPTGTTASGHPTNKYGQKLGPSGEPQVNTVKHSTEKRAKDAARNQGSGAPVKHQILRKEETIIIQQITQDKRKKEVHIMNIKENIWIGLAHVSSRPGNDLLNGADRAYVNILAIADNSSDFLDKVKIALEDIKLDFIQIEDIELFSKRREKYKIDKEIINLAIEVTKTKELRFGTFHTYNS